SPLAKQGHQSDLNREDRRLDHLRLSAIGIIFKCIERSRNTKPRKQLVALFNRTSKHRLPVHQLSAHAGPLCSLTGEYKHESISLAGRAARLQCRMRFAVEKTSEQRDELSLRATNERHSIRKMTATQTRRMGQIVQATFRIAGRQQLFAKLFRVSVQRL